MSSKLIKFNVALINLCTELEGPFKRVAIWFQGCNIKCEGCCNPDLQTFEVQNILTSSELLDIVLKSKEENSVEGVTFLGGEPTLQFGLDRLARIFRKNQLGTILFTGKNIENLSKEYIECFDMIVDGAFNLSQLDNDRNLIGSKNQNINLVTERYSNHVDWFLEKREIKNEINVGSVFLVNGDVID